MNSTAPCEIVLAVHLPLLRIGDPGIAFAGGELWQMPFETFDTLTAGVFTDRRASYEAVAPVFLRVAVLARPNDVIPADASGAGQELPASHALELLARIRDSTVVPAWQALLLHAPQGVLPDPRWSVAFAIAPEGFAFRRDDGSHGRGTGRLDRAVCSRGPAGVGYLFEPEFVGTPLQREAIVQAQAWAARLAEAASIDASLRAALRKLADANSPLLAAADRSILATMALEGLLLPEVRSGLARTLARRLAVLLGGSAVDRRAVRAAARSLYDARSACVQGEKIPPDAQAAAQAGVAMRLLARAIRALAHRVGDGTVADVLARLDGPASTRSVAPEAVPVPALPLRQPLCVAGVSRASVAGTALASQVGDYLLWAPLIGLQVQEDIPLDDAPGSPMLKALGAEEWAMLEDSDVAALFAGASRGTDARVAALTIALSPLDVLEDPDGRAALERLAHRRDVAVAALRLAGFDCFCDPALLGPVMVQRAARWRQPTVLRRAVWQAMGDAAQPRDSPTMADRPRIRLPWRLLAAYDASPHHVDIAHCLSLFRGAFDHRFTDATARLAMRFAVVEALLGRFRPDAADVQLEDLVRTLAQGEGADARWFAAHGRVTRRALSHGDAAGRADRVALDALNRIAIAALQRAIALWLDQPDATRRPGTVLIETLSRGFRASG